MALNKLDFVRVNVACDWICLAPFAHSLLRQLESRIQPNCVACKWNCATAFAINLLRKTEGKNTLIVAKVIGFAASWMGRHDLQVENFLYTL
jgi:hypothetical protein